MGEPHSLQFSFARLEDRIVNRFTIARKSSAFGLILVSAFKPASWGPSSVPVECIPAPLRRSQRCNSAGKANTGERGPWLTRRTGIFSCCSQRCTVLTPRFNSEAISFHECRIARSGDFASTSIPSDGDRFRSLDGVMSLANVDLLAMKHSSVMSEDPSARFSTVKRSIPHPRLSFHSPNPRVAVELFHSTHKRPLPVCAGPRW